MALLADGPRVLPRPEHPISRKNIDLEAVKVLKRLHQAGFKSFMVGGAVRDLLLDRRPKDFDISTDARPQQIRRLFRNSRIIGRRFRLVHIYFKSGIVEVATFRRDPDPQVQARAPGEMLITDDNVFGTPEEDAYRRDFTINALFYDVSDFSVVDYVGGIDDLEAGVVRVIGDPDLRFCEDPVRMLRACEMAGRLGFEIEPATEAGVRRNRLEIEKASPVRLGEEVTQLLCSGACGPILSKAKELGLLEIFLPEAYQILGVGPAEASGFRRIPEILDAMIADGRKTTDAVLLGSLLLPFVLLRRRDIEALNQRPIWRRALRSLTADTVDSFAARFSLSRARTERVHSALWSFHRLGERWNSRGSQINFAQSPAFDDALMLLEILVKATAEGQDTLECWQRIRGHLPDTLPARPAPTRKRRRRRRRRR